MTLTNLAFIYSLFVYVFFATYFVWALYTQRRTGQPRTWTFYDYFMQYTPAAMFWPISLVFLVRHLRNHGVPRITVTPSTTQE